MVQMFFYLRFRSQLRRVRSEAVFHIEDSFVRVTQAAGGLISRKRRLLSASFDDKQIGFWLDMLLLIEKMDEVLKKSQPDLAGHALVISQDEISEYDAEKLCRSISPFYTGIWCAVEAMTSLEGFCFFSEPQESGPHIGYVELMGFRLFTKTALNPHREKIIQTLKSENEYTLLLGKLYMDIRDGLYYYSDSIMGDITPLIIRFDSGTPGPICFADALTPKLRAMLGISFSEKDLEELDSLAELLFRERLRDIVSPLIILEGRRFLTLLLSHYIRHVQAKPSETATPPRALIILENPLKADRETKETFRGVFSSLENKDGLLVYGINTPSNITNGELGEWGTVFSRIVRISLRGYSQPKVPDMDKSLIALWEAAYTIFLLSAYFPLALHPKLFEEEGINPLIYEKALELLSSIGIIDTVLDPRPCSSEFIPEIEDILKERVDTIKTMVINRLLDWEISGRIRPCFNLLRILNELGGKPEISLILRALRGDIFNGTYRGIEEALANNRFELYTGQDNARILQWIFNTKKALVCANPREVREAFVEEFPLFPATAFLLLGAQVQANLCAFQLGTRNISAAAETIKDLLLLNQNLKDGGIPAFRYFSILNVGRHRLQDALEYNSFAVDLAEKTENREEQVKVYYFAAITHFLNGNLPEAERSILQAEKKAAELGWDEWQSRSRFFRGRCRFEAGYYRDALELFESLQGEVLSGTAQETLAAWIYRTNVFLCASSSQVLPENFKKPDHFNDDHRIFAIEAAVIQGNYQEAVDLGELFLPTLDTLGGEDDDFIFVERPDWRSGFAQCEYISFPERKFQLRLLSVYYDLAKSYLPLSTEEKNELRMRMQRMIREDLINEEDPNCSFYLYAWHRILKETGAHQGEISTTISMAYNRMQRRATSIDNMEYRKNFISLNYWNSALSLAAREYNPI